MSAGVNFKVWGFLYTIVAMTQIDLSKVTHVHFFGIGGIGVSAIARMMHLEGKKVSGSDIAESEVTKELQKIGVSFSVGQAVLSIPEECDLIVYTVAMPQLAPDFFDELKKLGIPMLSYPEMLEIVSAEKYTIAVSGTHGKTTTSAMVARVLQAAKLDPTVIVGSLLKEERSNFIGGKSKYLVIEADEYKRAFIHLTPSVLVINNVDLDHLDYYKDLEDVQKAFREVVEKIQPGGFVVCDAQHPHVIPVIANCVATVIDTSKITSEGLALQVPGTHNLQNAKAALGVAASLSIDRGVAVEALNKFSGTWRRFDYKGMTPVGALVYDDYAHNPQKVRAALQGAREKYKTDKIVVVYQPHTFSRTKGLFAEFTESFEEADEVLFAPIYPARETFDPSINSEMLADALRKKGKSAKAFDSFDQIVASLISDLHKNDVVMVVGAGDINAVAEKLVSK
jgi:UDP-N-acetylmuramate--alanine ligase